eukprot:m.35060 g.35060  ORF g.35060 m.35060 type:complete len:221 (-) comp9985_c0_seq2:243-905(-)
MTTISSSLDHFDLEVDDHQLESNTENNNNDNDNIVSSLSEGLLEMWEPRLNSLRSTLAEISEAQRELLTTVREEQTLLVDNEAFASVAAVMAKIPLYSHKIDTIRKDMVSLQEKSKKLKKRADKLALKRTQRAEDEAKRQRHAIERERKLAAKPVDDVKVVQQSSSSKLKKSSTTSKSKLPSTNSSTSMTAEPEDQIIVVNPGPMKKKKEGRSSSSSSKD